MARTVAEIVVGTGTLYVAAQGTAAPNNPGTAPSGGWTDVGYSEDGWAFEADKTFEDVFVAEEVDSVATFKTAQSIRLTGVLSQVSLDNFKLVMAGGTITTGQDRAGANASYDLYTPPVSDGFEEKSLLLRVTAPGNSAWLRDIFIPRAVAAGAFQLQHTKAPQKALLGVEFRAIKPTSGDIFDIVDQVA